MNNPEYILVDEIGSIAAAVSASLGRPINYQYGYIQELNETLLQMDANPENSSIKFPLIYLAQPFTILRAQGNPPDSLYGSTNDMRILILNDSVKTWKAADRMQNNFKPILYPIYRELLQQLAASVVFNVTNAQLIPHKFVDRYWWGDQNQKKSVIDDIVDCIDLQNITLKINNNQNCLPFKSFR